MLLSLVEMDCFQVEERARSCDKQSERYKRRRSWPSVRPPSWGCSPGLFIFHLPSYKLTVGSLTLRSWIWRSDFTTMWEYWDKSQGSLGQDEWNFSVQPFLAQIFFCLAPWVWIFLLNPIYCYMSPKAEDFLSALLVLRHLYHLICPFGNHS